MNFDDPVEEMDSKVECSQPLSPHRDKVFKKIYFTLVCAPPVESSQIVVPSPSSGGHGDIIQIYIDIFPDKDKSSICGELRRFVALSHNRFKQKKHKLRAKPI
ncbi:uncharacterized protein LOC120781712 [Bactrocera tryoni]|uniref:uncharacterized protein LOC120781712 n=1 Tax=Bactrocera tryoni TaxID=59916 RepID=UPI001A9591B9|nr:uncharacterized protein LOC120781712 [Bactrocera tryoni]